MKTRVRQTQIRQMRVRPALLSILTAAKLAVAGVAAVPQTAAAADPINVGNVDLGTLVTGHIHNRFNDSDTWYAGVGAHGSQGVWQAIAAANPGLVADGAARYVGAVGAANLPSDLELLTANLGAPIPWLDFSARTDRSSSAFTFPSALSGLDPVAVANAYIGAGGTVHSQSCVAGATQDYPISANWGETVYVEQAGSSSTRRRPT